jgi:hypothetical protein
LAHIATTRVLYFACWISGWIYMGDLVEHLWEQMAATSQSKALLVAASTGLLLSFSALIGEAHIGPGPCRSGYVWPRDKICCRLHHVAPGLSQIDDMHAQTWLSAVIILAIMLQLAPFSPLQASSPYSCGTSTQAWGCYWWLASSF